jgi:hypothetical protein
MRALFSLCSLCIVLVLALASPADAQRRRRPTRRTHPTTHPTTDPAPPEVEDVFPEPSEPVAPAPTTTAPTPAPVAPPPPAAQVTPDAPVPTSTAPSDPGPVPPDLSPLRAEYTSVMDDMVAARQLVSTLGEELFRTRVAVTVQDRAGDDQSLARFALSLDGAPIFRTETEIEGGAEGRQVYEGALAPGPHVLTVEIEQRASADTEYRYVQHDTYRFVVVRDRRTELTIVLEDDSDIAQQFTQGGEGRYDVHTRVRVATRALED